MPKTLKACVIASLLLPFAAMAGEAGKVKTLSGTAHIERAGQSIPVSVGAQILEADRIVTGADGAVGISFKDNSMLTTGANSVLEINQFQFDTKTHAGRFESTLSRGTLSAVSGKIVKKTPEAMRIRTPTTILGVRGTEFVVQVETPTP